MGVINSPLVEGGVFSEEVNKKEVTVNGVNSNKKSVRITIILHTLFAIISLLLYIVSYTVLCDLKITFFVFQKGCLKNQSTTPQETTSPIPTVSIISGIGRFTPYPK